MAYKEALEAAGAKVHAFEEFGSYQGDWWAFVTLADGKTGWIHGYYGSCSGCDAFEGEFGWHEEECDDHRYEPKEKTLNCEACAKKKEAYQLKLKNFGEGYLIELLSQEEAEKKANENSSWDLDTKNMVDFIIKTGKDDSGLQAHSN